jgi:hypothetical protein
MIYRLYVGAKGELNDLVMKKKILAMKMINNYIKKNLTILNSKIMNFYQLTKNRWLFIICSFSRSLILFFLFLTFSFLALISCKQTDEDRIKPWEDNPYYWQYKGEPILLLGGSDDDNLFQWEEDALKEHLDILTLAGGNYIRNTMSSRDSGNVEPFIKLENGLYDLNRWNDVYWERFRNLLNLSLERDIIVQIELWDMHDWFNKRWDEQAFNPINNINYSDIESGLPVRIEFGPLYGQANEHPFFQSHISEKRMDIVLSYQENFIKKIIETSINYPNVLYCINNESAIDTSWSYYWLGFTREISAKIKKMIYIGDMLMIPSSHIITDKKFDFADISQTASNLYRPRESNVGEGHMETVIKEVDRIISNPAPLNSVKQYGGDIIPWSRGANEGVERCWRSIFGGQAGVRFHRPPAGQGLNEIAQANIKSLRIITDHFDLKNILSHQKLSHLFLRRNLNDAYLMGNEGKVLAVFFTNAGNDVELDISSLGGKVSVKWINTKKAEWESEEYHKGNQIQLIKPDRGQWVALVASVNN